MNTKTLAILTMVTLALTLPLASASDWTQFHCDPEHTGYSTSCASNTNDLAWQSDDIGAHSASSVTIADGRVFVYCWDYLVCLDEYTGAVLWNVSVDKTRDVCGSWVTPAYNDGCVFLSANETYCFDATDGSLIRTFEPPTGQGAVDGGCAIAEGMVITSDWDGSHYYCLDESDGTEIWNFGVVDNYAQSTPAISGGRVVFGSWTWGDGGHIYCVNLTTGSEEWAFATPHHPCGSAAISGGVAYVATYNFSETREPGELYALDLTDGSVIWSQPVERTDSTPALAYGNVYVCGGCLGFSDLMTYCFDATTGTLVWSTSASDEIGNWKCSPAVADGKVFVGKPYYDYGSGVMDYVGTCALDACTGEIVWSYPEGGSSPAVADGMVFTVGGGRVYAFASPFWSGDVTLGSGTFNVTADDGGKEYTISRTCALAALIRAAEKGGFNYTLSDSWYESYGSLLVTSIAGRENDPVTWDGWCYWVNYPDDPMPMVGANTFGLSDGDVVELYYGGMGAAPNNTDMLIRIETRFVDWTQFHHDVANTGSSPANAPATNQMKWISENISAAEGSQAIIVGAQVFAYISVADEDDAIYALNRATGKVEWSATFPGETKDWGSSTTPAYSDGVVFAAAGYNVTGFDADAGTKLQEVAFPDGGYLSNGGVTVADGMVFVGSGSGANYYALDASDLTEVVWNYTTALSRAYSTPAVADDRVIFGDAGWGFDDGYLYCVDEFTGVEVWSTLLTGLVWGSATIDAANNRVYVATAVDWDSDAGKLYALTFDTGAVRWSAGINYTSSTPAVSGGYVYVAASGTAPGVTYCFDSAGVEQWNVPSGSRKISPAVADGKLFTGNVGLSGMASEGTEGIDVYDATTGALVWQHEHAGSSPSVAQDADGNGIVVSIGTDGMVYAFGGEGMMGDVNDDGEVTTADAALALRMAVGSVVPNDAADVNRDGAVTSLDALMIMQAVAGAITI